MDIIRHYTLPGTSRTTLPRVAKTGLEPVPVLQIGADGSARWVEAIRHTVTVVVDRPFDWQRDAPELSR